MATGIPLPGTMIDALMGGLKTGSGLYANAMHPILEREKQKQLEQHFQEQLKLSKASAGRNAQLFPFRLQELQDKHAAAEFERNMMNQLMGGEQPGGNMGGGSSHENDGYPALNKMFSGQGAFNEGEMHPGNIDLSNRPNIPNPETGGISTVYSMSIGTPQGEVLIPRVSDDGRILSEPDAIEQFHKTGKHLGVYSSPDEANRAAEAIHQQQALQTSKAESPAGNSPLLHKLMQNPMMRGWFKHKFGYDPLAPTAQTPEEKQAMALDLFKQKEQVKQNAKAGDIATNKVLTQNQSALQAIDTVMPMLDEFIKHPDKVYGQFDFSPSKKAAYEAKTGGMIDMLVAAQALPQVKESVELVKDQVRRRANETTPAYIKRLKDFKKDLAARRSKSKSVVESKRVNTQSGDDEFAYMSDDELRKIAGGG